MALKLFFALGPLCDAGDRTSSELLRHARSSFVTFGSLRLIALAFLIAGPLGWFMMNAWLHDFAYRISLSWWIFALSGAGSVLIAALTVSYQAFTAATANLVTSILLTVLFSLFLPMSNHNLQPGKT
jgi:hypothetical protein